MRCGVLSAAAFCLGTSALATPVLAAVIDYPNGSDNAAPIVLTDNTTQLQVLTGSATQSGVISETGGSWRLEKTGTGKLILSSANSYTGGTTISGGVLQIGDTGAVGSGSIALNGALRSTVSGTLANAITLADGSTGTISAATGQSITFSGTLALGSSAHLVLGSAADNGTLNFNLSNVTSVYPRFVEIAGGTVTDVNSHLAICLVLALPRPQ
ncbi:MAG: autotransporter-associated beta strand repeat-containing protein [Alphaproteobacteria bacterium]|nr:autotransporter-associated beta strand repeat-containing protein [Alphaproteobacteria bacterium]